MIRYTKVKPFTRAWWERMRRNAEILRDAVLNGNNVERHNSLHAVMLYCNEREHKAYKALMQSNDKRVDARNRGEANY